MEGTAWTKDHGEKVEGYVKMSPLHSPCPYPGHSKQAVPVHRSFSIFCVRWKDPVRSPVWLPPPFHHPADIYVSTADQAPCRVLRMQARHLLRKTFILVGEGDHKHVTQQLD